MGAWSCGVEPGAGSDDLGGESGSGGGSGGATGDITLAGSGGGLGAEAGFGGAVCAEAETSAELVPTNLLFVVDSSGSMHCNAPPVDTECLLPEKKVAAQPSKWESTVAALVGQDDAATSEQDERGLLRALVDSQGLRVGLLLFPVDDRCGLLARGELSREILPLDTEQFDALSVALQVSPMGETPLAGASIRGLDILRAGLVSGELPGNGHLVVMTDGDETCQRAALTDLRSYVETARDGFGIHTHVIGAPGSEGARSELSELAFLGGTGISPTCRHGDDQSTVGDCHLDLTQSDDFAGDLTRVFANIAASTQARCDFDVPQGAFVDPNRVNIELRPKGGPTVTFPRDDRACELEADGWQYTSASREKIVLCGAACDQVRAEAEAQVRVIFGCRETVVR